MMKTSRKEIFKAVMCFALVTGFCFNGFAKNPHRDMAARKKLVEKYKDHELIRARLDTILFPKFDVWKKPIDLEEANKFFGAPYDIADEKIARATEALVDLLDFFIGEHNTAVTIPGLISCRGREAIPFLKRKMTQKPLSFERETWDRNEVIVKLIKTISCGVKYFEVPEDSSKEEIVRSYLFSVQMDLEEHYREKGRYPKTFWPGPKREIIEYNIGQELKYKGYGLIYFLCALGEDGKFGTKDDVKPPYNTDVFSFPEHFE
jgi:hypothetical protein